MGIRDEDLEGGLFEAFKAPDESALATIERLHGAGSSILLRETEEDVTPVLVRRPGPGAVEDDSRYQVLGEIARGGIGVVYKGRDKDLNRDIALKVLRPEYAQREDVVQRFVEEAQVAGQLQHPGIVPVYGIGLQEDGRPSFAMKLIKGQTLAELLDSNPRGLDLIAIFEQVAQTMAYAHSRGVIHRDLKPANVMVGAFGEVQVVDWGFAKVLGQADVQRVPDRTVIATVRSGPVGSQSIAGSVMGTPAYMPPEQAMGQIGDLDERSDVFALGAILCEILTGQPPYTGELRDQLIAAAQSRLEPALERLRGADAADELKQLGRDCLEPMPSDRPRNARIVAERLSKHLSGAEERARQAELDAVTAETGAASAQRARRRALVRAAVALFVILAGGGGFFVWKSGRDAREAQAAPLIAKALREASRYEGEHDWARAVAAAQRAVDMAASEGVDDQGAREVLSRVRREQREIEEAERIQAEDDALLAELEEIRGRLGSAAVDSYAGLSSSDQAAVGTTAGWTLADEHRDIDASYARAFQSRLGPLEATVERLRQSPHAAAFAANLDFWSWLRRTKTTLRDSDWKTLHRIAREIDPESREVRDALVEKDEEALLGIASESAERFTPAMAAQLGRVLHGLEQGGEALRFLTEICRRHPDDFWLHMRLGHVASAQNAVELATRHFGAAVALRPRHASAWMQLAKVLRSQGDITGALVACKKAVSLAPKSAGPPNMLGTMLCDDLGQYDEAVETFRRAVALAPDFLIAQANIGVALRKKGDFDRAIAELSDVLARNPEYAHAHGALGVALAAKGDREGAIASYHRALELDATDAYTWSNLGAEFSEMGEQGRALEALREAVKHGPDLAPVHQNLAESLRQAGRLAEALAAAERAIAIQPNRASYYASRGGVLMDLERLDEAVTTFRKAIGLEPKIARFHSNLADALWRKRDLDAALPAARKSVEVDPKYVWGLRILGVVHIYRRELDEAFRALEKALALEPENDTVWADLGVAHAWAGNLDQSLRARRKAVELDPQRAAHRYNLGSFLLQFKRAPAAGLLHLEKAVKLNPSHPQSWCNLGHCLRMLDRWIEAVDAFQRGHELGSAQTGWAYPSAQWVAEAERMAAFQRAQIALTQRKDVAAALELYRKALAAHAEVAKDPRSGHRYNAACAAVLAGSKHHAEALVWLRADLDAWSKLLQRHPRLVADAITHWRNDSDLAAVRDAEDLPADWKKLWADVDALLKRAKEAAE